jgi:uncharacterized surface protein with fasciclin (FAS1) repeats
MRLTRAAACRSLVGCLVALSLTSPVLAQPRPATVLELAAQQKNLTTFVAAVHTAGLDDTLKSAGPYTIYAPSDEAFAKLSAADRAALLGSPERLRAVLLGHVVKDMVKMRDGETSVTSGGIATVGGRELAFAVDDHDRQLVAGAHLVAWDMQAGNGCVNVIDKVLLP